jgi:hypothetical protein
MTFIEQLLVDPGFLQYCCLILLCVLGYTVYVAFDLAKECDRLVALKKEGPPPAGEERK